MIDSRMCKTNEVLLLAMEYESDMAYIATVKSQINRTKYDIEKLKRYLESLEKDLIFYTNRANNFKI